ncbi:DegT/DnrJ/EryC1/StrS family aminotransferase [Sorangium sp. So ce281]|uniref:DegT/DnrJ/EryC1/StrS family aminotransferase n=1 Tax=unclassified Sorangium TaxID=2621164 RepID=UPI003F5E83D0
MTTSYRLHLDAAQIDRIVESVRDILSRGHLLLGPYTSELESRFATRTSRRHCVAVSSGTTALEIILRHIGVSGRKVLVPANTNYATALSALNAGAQVSLYDGGLYPDLDSLYAVLDRSFAAVIVVHIGGYITPHLTRIREACSTLGVPLVEDAAHAHGSMLDGVPAGSQSYAAAFSLFPTKVMTSGEGGLIVTDDDELAKAARSLRNQGKDDAGEHVLLGNSWRITEVGAAIACAQLDRLDDACRMRREVIARYAAAAKSSRLLGPIEVDSRCSPNGYKAILTTRDRRATEAALRSGGIASSGGVYHVPLHRLPVFRGLFEGTFSVAERFADGHVCLPCWYGMAPEDTARVCDFIASV